MTGEVELVSDGDGVMVAGNRSAIERFLGHAGLLAEARVFDLRRLSRVVHAGADAATAVSGIIEQSGMYLKLTPESAKRLEAAGGLMKARTRALATRCSGRRVTVAQVASG